MAPNVTVECVLCKKSFTEEDILGYRYFIETGICYRCYRRMQSMPSEVSCFGKNGSVGYNPISIECKVLCPDRKVCPLFAFNRIKKLRLELSERTAGVLDNIQANSNVVDLPFRKGSVIHHAFQMCQEGITDLAFTRFAKRSKCSKERLLGTFRSGVCYGKKWKWSESNGVYKITYPISH